MSAESQALHDLLAGALAGGPESVHALSHFVELWHQRRPGQTAGNLLGGDGTTYRVRFAEGERGLFSISYLDELSPAEDFEVRKIEPHYRRDGAGAPLLGIRTPTDTGPSAGWEPRG